MKVPRNLVHRQICLLSAVFLLALTGYSASAEAAFVTTAAVENEVTIEFASWQGSSVPCKPDSDCGAGEVPQRLVSTGMNSLVLVAVATGDALVMPTQVRTQVWDPLACLHLPPLDGVFRPPRV